MGLTGEPANASLSGSDLWQLVGFLVGIIGLLLAALAMWKAKRDAELQLKHLTKLVESTVKLENDTKGQLTHLGTLVERTAKLERDADAQVKRVETLLEWTSTKPLGAFPVFIGTVCEMIEEAQRSVLILCDFPRFGYFTAPDEANRIIHALERNKPRLNIQFLCSGPTVWERLVRLYYTKHWENRDDDSEAVRDHFEKIRGYEQRNGRTVRTLDHLVEGILQDQRSLVTRPEFVEVRRLPNDEQPMVHCWIVDNAKAVLSFPGDSNWTEYGFRTDDVSLITELAKVHLRYWNRASVSADWDDAGSDAESERNNRARKPPGRGGR